MLEGIIANPTVAEAIEILKSELFLAIWETFYVTVAATFFSILIGLPLGVLIVAGEKGGVMPSEACFERFKRNYKSAAFNTVSHTYDTCFSAYKAYNGHGCGNGGFHCAACYSRGAVCGKAC